jgi:transcriptional regulator with XRE-family HTH domain
VPNAIDVLIGRRMCGRRAELLISQSDLSHKLGIPLQQVQKYETGAIRVGCGRLTQIAEALNVELSYFFADSACEKSNSQAANSLDLEKIGEGQRLLSAFGRIDDRRLRKKTIEFLESLVVNLE